MKEKWLPTSIDTIKNSFEFLSTDVVKKNIAYNIQYLQYLTKNIEEDETTSVLYRMRYKTFVIIAMSIIEAVFMALLDERNLIPLEEWKEGNHHHQVIDENTIKVSFERKKIKPSKKKIKFDEAIHLIECNDVLNLKKSTFPVIRELQNLRNQLHLDKAKNLNNSDYNSFNESTYFITKIIFYYIMSSKSISNNTDYLYFCKDTK